MAGRGRGRGRSFGRGKPFANTDQLNSLSVEKVSSVQHSSPYPALDFHAAPLSMHKDYDDLLKIRNQLSADFQSSNYHLKVEDESAKLFSSQGETVVPKKTMLNFHWDFFPLELRPTSKRKLKKCEEMLDSLRKNKMVSVDLSWLDTLEEKEKDTAVESAPVVDENAVKKEPVENMDAEEEAEEFDDEELDLDTDYNTNYFDDGEGYLDEDNDLDEGPCF